jgi:hypothetical protein
LLATPQRYPRAGSQSYPTPAAVADADGTTTVYFGPIKPANVKDGNWIQTDPEERLVRAVPPLQSTRTVLHRGLATGRSRIGSLSR